MKGYYEKTPSGRIIDRPPCGTCKYKNKMTVEAPCYNCIDVMDLALHKPNAETTFASYSPASQEIVEP